MSAFFTLFRYAVSVFFLRVACGDKVSIIAAFSKLNFFLFTHSVGSNYLCRSKWPLSKHLSGVYSDQSTIKRCESGKTFPMPSLLRVARLHKTYGKSEEFINNIFIFIAILRLLVYLYSYSFISFLTYPSNCAAFSDY